MSTSSSPRIGPVAPEARTEAQREAAAEVESGPRGAVRGPFAVLLHSPEAFDRVQRLGGYLRYDSLLPADLRELAVLVTARAWNQDYEWRAHAPLAEQAGVDRFAIAEIERGARPAALTRDQAAVYAFCAQLHATNRVDDTTFAEVRALLGEPALIDLCVICGYYALLAMVLNVAKDASGGGLPTPFKTA